jgi:hypothetical protein
MALAAPLANAQVGTLINSYPTVDRVLYVHECMRDHPGPHFEMVNKCACALDRLAQEVSFDDYVAMSTAANATTIGGERGGYIRESESLQVEVRRYKALQVKVKKACFVTR